MAWLRRSKRAKVTDMVPAGQVPGEDRRGQAGSLRLSSRVGLHQLPQAPETPAFHPALPEPLPAALSEENSSIWGELLFTQPEGERTQAKSRILPELIRSLTPQSDLSVLGGRGPGERARGGGAGGEPEGGHQIRVVGQSWAGEGRLEMDEAPRQRTRLWARAQPPRQTRGEQAAERDRHGGEAGRPGHPASTGSRAGPRAYGLGQTGRQATAAASGIRAQTAPQARPAWRWEGEGGRCGWAGGRPSEAGGQARAHRDQSEARSHVVP